MTSWCFIASHLVDSPEMIALEQEEREDKIVFRLRVAQHDVGKVIGKKGRTAQSSAHPACRSGCTPRENGLFSKLQSGLSLSVT